MCGGRSGPYRQQNPDPAGWVARGQLCEACVASRRARPGAGHGRRLPVRRVRLGWPRGLAATAGRGRERHDRRPTNAARHHERLPAIGRARHIRWVPPSVPARHSCAPRRRPRSNRLGYEPRTRANASRPTSHPIPQRKHAGHATRSTAPARLGLAVAGRAPRSSHACTVLLVPKGRRARSLRAQRRVRSAEVCDGCP